MYFFYLKKLIAVFFIYFIMCFTVSFANVWGNNTSLENIIKTLPDINDIKCKFKQEKIIPNIDKPILSSGNFEFIKNEGVYFYINYPINSEINYTNKNYKQINDVIKAIASKKYKKLEKEFDFYLEKENNKWVLGLKPKEKTAEFLSSIIIEGNDDYLQKIKIEMINGNTTTIWFIQ